MTNRTIGYLLEERANTHKEKKFIHFEDKIITYNEMNKMANCVAHGFLKSGVKKGDKVCIMLPNCLEFLYIWFALSKIGAVPVPINTDFKGIGLAHMLNTTNPKVSVIDSTFLDRLHYIKDELKISKKFFILDGSSKEEASQYDIFDLIPYSSLVTSDSSSIKEKIDPTDHAMFMFTSGTTGPSKAIVITHNFAIHAAGELIKHFGLRDDDVLYCPFPLFHADGALLTVLPALILGATAALSERFSASRFWDEVRHYGATVFDYMGAVLAILYKRPPQPDDGDNPARLAWGVPVPDFWREFEERFKLKLATGYGLTDAGTFFVFNPLDKELEPGLCGLPSESVDVRIFDDNDNELPPMEVGEIVMRPRKPYTIMECYYNMPEATVETYRNLWFHSGDMGYKDKEGYIYFVSRKKDAIRRRGENISSWEIEQVINSHPLVMEAAAFGVPSELTEEDVKVCIVLKPGAELSIDELVQYCSERMARFMIPRYIEIMDSFPKTATGKVEKYKLKEVGINKYTFDRGSRA